MEHLNSYIVSLNMKISSKAVLKGLETGKNYPDKEYQLIKMQEEKMPDCTVDEIIKHVMVAAYLLGEDAYDLAYDIPTVYPMTDKDYKRIKEENPDILALVNEICASARNTLPTIVTDDPNKKKRGKSKDDANESSQRLGDEPQTSRGRGQRKVYPYSSQRKTSPEKRKSPAKRSPVKKTTLKKILPRHADEEGT